MYRTAGIGAARLRGDAYAARPQRVKQPEEEETPRQKNTIFNNGRYTTNIPTDPHTVTTTDIKTNMRHIHTSIISRHLATRGNNKILCTPQPPSLKNQIPSSSPANKLACKFHMQGRCKNRRKGPNYYFRILICVSALYEVVIKVTTKGPPANVPTQNCVRHLRPAKDVTDVIVTIIMCLESPTL